MNMTKKQIEKRYNKLIDDIESMSIYDGRGTVDRYECKKCGAIIHTTYAEKGVTPFSIGCRMSGYAAYSFRTFDKATVPPSVKVLNWYRPSLEATLKMSEGEIEHILNGGLILEVPK